MREEAILVARFLRLTRPIIDEQIKELHELAKEQTVQMRSSAGASVPSPVMPAHAPVNPVVSGIAVTAVQAPVEAMDEDDDEEEALQRALALSMSDSLAPVTKQNPSPSHTVFVWANDDETD